jgi:hypothetical protein
MKSRTALLRHRIIGVILLALLCPGIPLLMTEGRSDVQFRKFQEDSSRFERYVDRAKDETSLADWERAVDAGKEALSAEWERDAEFKIQSELRRNGNDPTLEAELRTEKETKRAEWEKSATDETADAKGAWYARRQNIVYGGFDRESLKDAITDAKAAAEAVAGAAKITAWDGTVNPVLSGVVASWEESLGSMLESVRLKSADLDAASRSAYEREIVKIEREVRDAFRLEKNTLLYRDRNKLIWDTLFDHASLRYLSEQESAAAVAARLLAETKDGLAKDKEKVLDRDTSQKEGASTADFSTLGSDWQQEIRTLMEQGNDRWKKAQDDLLAAMKTWKENAGEAYAEGERRWQAALERLTKERDDWRMEMNLQVQEGISNWQKQQDDLIKSITDAKNQYTAYLINQNNQWNSYSSKLFSMLVDGRQTVIDTEGYSTWLHDKSQEYYTKGFFSGSFRNNSPDPQELVKYGYLDQMLSMELSNAENTASQTYPADSWRVKVGQDCQVDKWGVEYNCHNNYHYFTQVMFGNPEITITNTLNKADYNNSTGDVKEQYTVTISVHVGYVHNDSTGVITQQNYYTTTLPMNYLISASTDQDKRSRYYYYINEDNNWHTTLTNAMNIVKDLETTTHDKNITGLDGGPGYLANSDGSYGLKYFPNGELDNDPYLMTQTELGYEYSRREEEYWHDRLTIAEDVLKYARPDLYLDNDYAPGGIREDAQTTKDRVDQAKSEMELLRDEYQSSLTGVNDLVTAMQTKKDEIDTLTQGLAGKKQAANDLVAPYNTAKLAVIEAENNGGASTQLLDDLKAKGDACSVARIAYTDQVNSVTTAQREYEALQKSYNDRINDNAAKYSTFQDAEFTYERAYAVWEYANTPYLSDTKAKESSLGSGMLADGTLADFDAFTAPDALENYQTILEMYEYKKGDFDIFTAAKAGQEKIEDLANDSAYIGYKNGLRSATADLITALAGRADQLTLETLAGQRIAALEAFRDYCAQSVSDNAHDNTVLLRDEEALYWDMLTFAKDSGSIEGYALVAKELINDGQGMSVDDRIMTNLMQQSEIFQEQRWNQQVSTFSEKKDRWMEVVGFIANRGERDWSSMVNSLLNQWRLWRVEAKEEIAQGEREWTASVRELGERIQTWNTKASSEASKEGAKALAEELGSSIDRYLATLNTRMSGNLGTSLNLKVDTNAILQSVLKSMPADMGILGNSMFAVNTTAGFSELLNLGLTGGVFEQYQREMAKFQDRMETMQSVKLGEMAYAGFMEMLSQFNNQIAAINLDVYNKINTDMNEADPYAEADFTRRNGYWEIRYISDYSLAGGTNHRFYAFQDYEHYENSTVFLKPFTGTNGKIDFANVYSYENLSAEEVNIYITMEQDHLTREIDNVMSAGGSLEQHTNSEFTRLGNAFGEGYKRWAEGEALVAGGWYSAPIAPGVPINTMTLAKVGGSIALSATLGPWAAFALNAAFTTFEASQGDLTWKQAAVQIGVNAAVTGLTVGAGDLMGSAFSDTHTLGAQLAVAGARSAVTTTGNTFAGCIQYNSSGGFDFDREKFTDNKTWSQAGLTFATSFAASAASIGLKEMNLNSNLLSTSFSTGINTLGQNISVKGDGGWDWQGFNNIDGQKAVIQGVGSYASSTLTGGMRDGYLQAMMSSMVSTYAQAGAAELFERYKGRDFGDQYSLDKAITVDTMSVAVEQLYNSTKETFLPEKERQNLEFARNQANEGDFLGTLRGLGNDLLSMGTGLINEVKNIGGDLVTMGKGVVATGKGFASIVEKTGNFFVEGNYATDQEVQRMKDIAASMEYHALKDELSKNNMTMGPHMIKKMIEWGVDTVTGELVMGGKTTDAFGDYDGRKYKDADETMKNAGEFYREHGNPNEISWYEKLGNLFMDYIVNPVVRVAKAVWHGITHMDFDPRNSEISKGIRRSWNETTASYDDSNPNNNDDRIFNENNGLNSANNDIDDVDRKNSIKKTEEKEINQKSVDALQDYFKDFGKDITKEILRSQRDRVLAGHINAWDVLGDSIGGYPAVQYFRKNDIPLSKTFNFEIDKNTNLYFKINGKVNIPQRQVKDNQAEVGAIYRR